MKPTIIIVVSLVTVSVIGITAMQLRQSHPPADPETPQFAPFSATQSTTASSSRATEPTPSPAATEQPDERTDSVVAFVDSDAVDVDCLKLVRLTERRAGSTDDLEKWTWRVELENESDRSQYCYVEIEWLDATGSRVDSAHELRRIKPGTSSISMVRAMDYETADQAKTVRVVELQTRPAPTDQ